MTAYGHNMDGCVRLPTVWGFQSGGGNMEDKLRALESPDNKVVTGALFGLERWREKCQ